MIVITDEIVQECKNKILKYKPKRPNTRIAMVLTNLNNVELAQKLWLDEEELRKYLLEQIPIAPAKKMLPVHFYRRFVKLRHSYKVRYNINWISHNVATTLLKNLSEIASHIRYVANTLCQDLKCDFVHTVHFLINKTICLIKSYDKLSKHYIRI